MELATSIPQRALNALRSDFDASFALRCLEEATEGEIYIFGGTVRNAVLNRPRAGDLDIMVPNGDVRAFEALDKLSVPFTLNSQKHRRYQWNRLQIDVFEPKDFFGGFATVEKALAHFDLRMNALAVHVATGQLFDPLKRLVEENQSDPGINWKRWDGAPTGEVAILFVRLIRLLFDYPHLRLPPDDVSRLLRHILPKVESIDWSLLNGRFPAGRDKFINTAITLLRERTGL
jgi:hypothetical protein